uniref:Aspartate--tRNA ligase, mitochondrial n=1 Tax=Cacopsylla melanoneura TaxID=428564 RepID=A0A8D9FFM3_9HEMI
MTYQDAMNHYGSDKPDLRYECKITNLDHLSSQTNTPADTDLTYCSLTLSNSAEQFSNKTLSQYQELAKKSYVGTKVTAVKIQEDSSCRSKLSKMIPELKWDEFSKEGNVKQGDVLVLAWGKRAHVLSLLGDIRVEFHRDVTSQLNTQPLDLNNPASFNICWIVDFPLFLPLEDESNGVNGAGLESAHHPFTLPHPDDEHLLLTKPLEVRGLHYDLVLNGNEIGGGSIRIHSSALQEQILQLLNIDPTTLQHMIQAFKYGCPPHGGIALGIDRLMSILCQTPTIRDVIAFPKGFGGKDHLSGAPCDVAKEEKDYYHLR